MTAPHRHPRAITPPTGQEIPTDDAAIIADLRRQLVTIKEDRDGLLHALARITAALGMPDGHDVDKVIQRIEGLA